MPKKILIQDMVRTKRPQKEITRVEKPVILEKKVEKRIYREPEPVPEREYTPKGKSPKYTLWVVAVISVIFCIFALSFLFSSATITVNPKIVEKVLNENLSASKEPVGGNLFFDLVVISGEEKSTLQATGEKEVADKAIGTVVIFNSFSSATQNLDIDTRLEGSNGKLYKTKNKITVPGMKDGTPGSVEVEIYANQSGSEYNSGPLDFQILGFKGTPKYDKFKVRSKQGTEIKGGFVGKTPIVSEEDKAKALAELHTALSEKLVQKAKGQVPNGFVLFKDAVFLNSGDADASLIYDGDEGATLTLKGTLYGLLFNKKKLVQKLAEKNIEKYDGSEIYVSNIEDLKLTLPEQANLAFNDMQNVNFNLSGSTKFVWKIDEKKFASELLGQPKKDFVSISAKHENIESASLKLIPPWAGTIPEESKKVKVIVNYPK